ncbi:glycosyltransferase [Nonomuraea africana]|uniref:Glycosyltransferase involved in cell wall biosynthesis n=1 Tax=Nonomuraea africana TaxID=46171 RepID=A0ABR9KPC1_9ACTN|nr:glycosyltransferase [Nonomuraea africana]MBE1563879.1 glycosyltransferase involved in cell wall biosynthesis [Nonomuraea africana]
MRRAGRTAGAGAAPRVLHVAQPVDGGVGAYVAAVAADQARRGWQVAVACPGEGPLPARLAEQGVPRLDWRAGRSPGLADLPAALRVRRLVRDFAPDAVHLHSAKAGLAGRAAIRGRIPTLFQPHGWSWLAARGLVAAMALEWERAAVRWADVLVCVGEGEAATALRNDVRGNLAIVRNGVDLRRFRPAGGQERAAARARHGIPDGAPLAVCVGRVTRQKGQDLLLSAWELVSEECGAARLAIVGDGDLLEALRSRNVPGVHFAGPVADPRSWYAAADVVVLPSRWEGLPLTALEALATGRALVAADVPGLAEVVGEKVGAAVPAGDVAALAGALLLRLTQPELAAAEGRAAALLSLSYDDSVALDALAEHTLRLVGASCGTGLGTSAAPTGAARTAEGAGTGVAGAPGAGVGVAAISTEGAGVPGTGVATAGTTAVGVAGAGVTGVGVTDVGVAGMDVTGVGVAGVGVTADAGGRSISRKTADERGFDEHCQTPCEQ